MAPNSAPDHDDARRVDPGADVELAGGTRPAPPLVLLAMPIIRVVSSAFCSASRRSTDGAPTSRCRAAPRSRLPLSASRSWPAASSTTACTGLSPGSGGGHDAATFAYASARRPADRPGRPRARRHRLGRLDRRAVLSRRRVRRQRGRHAGAGPHASPSGSRRASPRWACGRFPGAAGRCARAPTSRIARRAAASCSCPACTPPGSTSRGWSASRATSRAMGHPVLTVELPDLTRYEITTRTTDMIEDAAAWMMRRPEFHGPRRPDRHARHQLRRRAVDRRGRAGRRSATASRS